MSFAVKKMPHWITSKTNRAQRNIPAHGEMMLKSGV
jgi:hypothetical protein